VVCWVRVVCYANMRFWAQICQLGRYHSSVNVKKRAKSRFLAISGAKTSPMMARMSKNGAPGGFWKWHDVQAWYYMLK